MSSFIKISPQSVQTNYIQGSYRPMFFDCPELKFSRVDFSSKYFNESNTEKELLSGNFSFAYLREDKLRLIDALNSEGVKIRFDQFLKYAGIEIASNNLFKTGKYLSRIFRPTRFGACYKNLSVHINSNPLYRGSVTDGISLISLKLAKNLGWNDAEANKSAQLTFFSELGLVKGHCVVSSTISSDLVIYGEDNIKTEIRNTSDFSYLAIEPVKISDHLRLDVQSLLNLWGMFGSQQMLSWVEIGIERFKNALLSDNLAEMIDNFEDIDLEDYNAEQWTLKKASWHKINIRQYPGLIRIAWTMMRNSIFRFAENIKGEPVFHIPVPSGKRGYLRVDLRNHDQFGNFTSTTPRGTVTFDKFGNIWIHQDDTAEFLEVKGGADLDDSAGVIPVESDKAIIYRNPNQFGEYGLHDIIYDGITIDNPAHLLEIIPYRVRVKQQKETRQTSTGNKMLDKYLSKREPQALRTTQFSIANLLKTYSRISRNTANVGLAANAEMVRSVVRIENLKIFERLQKNFVWNLEHIIDATVKEGTDATEDMAMIEAFYLEIIDKKIKLPAAILSRIPEKHRGKVTVKHGLELDEFLEAIKYLVSNADIEVLGQGAASSGKRIKGMIDYIETPLVELGYDIFDNPLFDTALSLLKHYRQSMAIGLSQVKAEAERKDAISHVQTGLLEALAIYSIEERRLMARVFAYQTYKTESHVHDSVLWIADKESLRGTSSDTIEMLADKGLAYQVEFSERPVRHIKKNNSIVGIKTVRIWDNNELKAEDFNGTKKIEIFKSADVTGITIITKITAKMIGSIFNVGDECNIEPGNYFIRAINQSVSKKNPSKLLKNSLTLILE